MLIIASIFEFINRNLEKKFLSILLSTILAVLEIFPVNLNKNNTNGYINVIREKE
jgi:hypothetical protein